MNRNEQTITPRSLEISKSVSRGQLNKFFIFSAGDYTYNSPVDYAGEKGLLDDVIAYHSFSLRNEGSWKSSLILNKTTLDSEQNLIRF